MQEKSERKVHASIASSADPTQDVIASYNMVLPPYRLDGVQAVHIAVVLEDLADQLEVLGCAMGGPPIILQSNTLFEPNQKNPHIEDYTGSYLSRHVYCSSIPKMLFETYFPKSERMERRLTEILKQNSVKQDTVLGKMQVDRAFLQWSIHFIIEDLLKNHSYEALKSVVENEHNKRKYMTDMFTKIINDTEKMKQLKVDIKRAKLDKIQEFQLLDNQIFEARDNLLEMNLRKPLEAAYTQKSHWSDLYGKLTGVAQGKASISRIRKMCSRIEKEASEEHCVAKWNIANEGKCHDSMMKIIRQKIKSVKQQHDHWTDRYDKDITRLHAELDELKQERARVLSRTAYLRKMIDDYEEIVQDDRRVKKRITNKIARRDLEMKRVIRIQAWWRGTMVRRCIGAFKTLLSDLKSGKKAPAEKKH